MPFVKLDCGILDSTLWMDKPARDVFITALLMAEPRSVSESVPQLEVRELSPTGWSVPANDQDDAGDFYGFVAAAGVGIVRRAGIENDEIGLAALERLGKPDPESRSQDFEGRRLVRVDGGYIALNYGRYRERDLTAAERQRRYRERQKKKAESDESRRNTVSVTHNVTEVEEEVEEDVVPKPEGSATPTVERKRSSKALAPRPSKTDAEPPFEDEILLTFPTQGKGGQEWNLLRSTVEEWSELYPGLNVIAECRKALAWVRAHHDKRKTVRGMPAFLVRWLNQATDSGRSTQGRPTTPTKARTVGSLDAGVTDL